MATNPWLKKNPFMSMWLSGANRVAGALRGQAAAQVKREASAAATKATYDNLKTMLGATKKPASPKAKPKKRRP